MKIWKEYKLTDKQAENLGFIRCRCGIYHDHILTVEKFLIWVRFPWFNNKFKYTLIP